jgi:uncharacterized membrane protein YfcA
MISIGSAPFFGSVFGILIGLLGGAGSVLTVPFLIYVSGYDIRVAISLSLAMVSVGAAVGAFMQFRTGGVRVKSGVFIGLLSFLGAVPGVWLNHASGEHLFLVLFGVMMAVVGLVMTQMKLRSSISPAAAPTGEAYLLENWPFLLILSIAVGLVTGYFGVGGGFLVIPALLWGGHLPAYQAMGTSLLVIVISSLFSLVRHISLISIDAGLVLLLGCGAGIGTFLGMKLLKWIPGYTLSKVYGSVLIVAGLLLIIQNIRGIMP